VIFPGNIRAGGDVIHSPPMLKNDLFLRACRREPVPRTPIWMMRQAGRYLSEYRAVRKKVSFIELCKTPELACEVTMQPIDLFGFDAAILFCDILIPLQAMGMGLVFDDHGPHLPEPLRDRAAIDKLVVGDPEAEMPYVMESVRLIRKTLDGRVPLIGFAGAPFTLATYAVEGGGSKNYPETKTMMYTDPEIAVRNNHFLPLSLRQTSSFRFRIYHTWFPQRLLGKMQSD